MTLLFAAPKLRQRHVSETSTADRAMPPVGGFSLQHSRAWLGLGLWPVYLRRATLLVASPNDPSVAHSGDGVMQALVPPRFRSKINRHSAYKHVRTALLVSVISTALPFFTPVVAQAAPVTFFATLGNFENPPTGSPGTGSATVTFDSAANTLRVQADFQGLLSTTSAAHIHCCVTTAGGNAGVATTTPSFVGFPLGVMAGSFDETYVATSASTFNPAFVTNTGGVENALAALVTGLLGGQAYFNIHTVLFGGGEIRGFLTPAPNPVPLPAALPLFATALGALGLLTWRRKRKAIAA